MILLTQKIKSEKRNIAVLIAQIIAVQEDYLGRGQTLIITSGKDIIVQESFEEVITLIAERQ